MRRIQEPSPDKKVLDQQIDLCSDIVIPEEVPDAIENAVLEIVVESLHLIDETLELFDGRRRRRTRRCCPARGS